MNGTEGNDAIEGRGGDDVISGLGGNDILQGDRGSDTLRGGDGNDRITGLQGASEGVDIMLGEGGFDTFHFAAHTTSRIVGFVPGIAATLGDFQTGIDKLELRLTGVSYTDTGLHWLNDQPFTGQNRLEVRLVEGVLQIDSDGDRVPELMLRVTGTITQSDILWEDDPFGY